MKNHPEITTNKQLREAALKAACENHIWINAFTLIRPTDETYREIGKMVVGKLRERDALLPSYHPGSEDSEEVSEIARLTRMLYLSVNALTQ